MKYHGLAVTAYAMHFASIHRSLKANSVTVSCTVSFTSFRVHQSQSFSQLMLQGAEEILVTKLGNKLQQSRTNNQTESSYANLT
jgi:hypothetical protein